LLGRNLNFNTAKLVQSSRITNANAMLAAVNSSVRPVSYQT